MVYRLCDAHKAVQTYKTHYSDVSSDGLTYARILHHREQLTKYSRICYGLEEAQKSAAKYIHELKKKIARPKGTRNNDGTEGGTNSKRKLPMKATPSRVRGHADGAQVQTRSMTASAADVALNVATARGLAQEKTAAAQRGKKSG